MTEQTSNIRKAAILVASLDSQTADALLRQMDRDHATLVRDEVASLGELDPREQRAVIDEFFRLGPIVRESTEKRLAAHTPSAAVTDVGAGAAAGAELDVALRKRLEITGAAHLEAPPWQRPQPAAEPFRFLETAAPDELLPCLSDEHPQTIALVLSHLPPERAATLLGTLARDVRTDVVRRLVDLDDANPDVVREVEQGLRSRLEQRSSADERRRMGVARVRAIAQAAGPLLERELLRFLDVDEAPLVDDSPLYRPTQFSDLERLDDSALHALLATAQPEFAVLALAGANPSLVARLSKQLGPRRGRELRRALARLGPTPLSDVEAAQLELIQLAEQLDAAGRIRLPRERVPSGAM